MKNQMPTLTSLKNQQAIVVGGSIAGLMAARILSNHLGSVVIIE
jgi:2-polyprenyl-6-methoxyphenol hydroxylase-like FAD-dependent oxidoreductase